MDRRRWRADPCIITPHKIICVESNKYWPIVIPISITLLKNDILKTNVLIDQYIISCKMFQTSMSFKIGWFGLKVFSRKYNFAFTLTLTMWKTNFDKSITIPPSIDFTYFRFIIEGLVERGMDQWTVEGQGVRDCKETHNLCGIRKR